MTRAELIKKNEMMRAELIKENEILRAALRRIMEYSSNEHIDSIRDRGIDSPYAYAVGQIYAVADFAMNDDTDIDIKVDCI